MAKRAAEHEEAVKSPLKRGDRPLPSGADKDADNLNEGFEDEFEDEYESEDEIFEAGVDGRPDTEREAEEKGTWTMPHR